MNRLQTHLRQEKKTAAQTASRPSVTPPYQATVLPPLHVTAVLPCQLTLLLPSDPLDLKEPPSYQATS